MDANSSSSSNRAFGQSQLAVDQVCVQFMLNTLICVTKLKKEFSLCLNIGILEYFHINFGKKLVNTETASAYCGIFEAGPTLRVIVYCGSDSEKNAGQIAKELSAILGGSGGGDAKFAQGGGKDTSKKDEMIAKAKSIILG